MTSKQAVRYAMCLYREAKKLVEEARGNVEPKKVSAWRKM